MAHPSDEWQDSICFLMTEPLVASSDATNIQTSIESDGDDYVINGRKWWSSGAMDPRCEIYIVMGKTDPDAHRYSQQSMILVPANTPGITVVRPSVCIRVLRYPSWSCRDHYWKMSGYPNPIFC